MSTRETTAKKMCECHKIDMHGGSDECERPLGRRYYMVTVVPDADRGSAAASGAYTYYGGLTSEAVSEACMRGWVRQYLATDDQRFVRVTRT